MDIRNPTKRKQDTMTTTTDTRTLEERIARHWTNDAISKALAQISPGCKNAKQWPPAMKRAIRQEAARRLENGDS